MSPVDEQPFLMKVLIQIQFPQSGVKPRSLELFNKIAINISEVQHDLLDELLRRQESCTVSQVNELGVQFLRGYVCREKV